MALKTLPLDLAHLIETPDDVAGVLEAVFAEGNPSDIAHALGTVARSRGMSTLAEQTGLSRQALHKALSAEGNPTLDTFLKVIAALHLKLTVAPAEAA
ncbi:addiction module antidote protein [Phenylobacterium sp.]|jgi:probable addiction module antidote protein|uniref:addiction module antidote protein n=1 Tax=Phenylobacterium sp. TaxID=1871053 RepID=UPI002F3F9255